VEDVLLDRGIVAKPGRPASDRTEDSGLLRVRHEQKALLGGETAMGRIGTGLAMVVLAAGLLTGTAAEAQEYTCRDRWSGRTVGHPSSRSDSQHFENANPRIDCFRKGAPVTSSRDERWARRRGHGFEYGHRDPFGDRFGDPWGRRHPRRSPWDW
jgi:hypothetical protein